MSVLPGFVQQGATSALRVTERSRSLSQRVLNRKLSWHHGGRGEAVLEVIFSHMCGFYLF